MYIRHVQILFYVLLTLSGCSNLTSKPSEESEQKENVEKEIEGVEKIKDTLNIRETPSIEGRYDLVDGYAFFRDTVHNHPVYKAILLVERISDQDFGFIIVRKVHGLSPVGEYGILSYHKDRFYMKNIDYTNKRIYYTNGMDIKIKDSLLHTIRYVSNATEYDIWKKSDPKSNVYVSLRKTLQREKEEYANFYNKISNDPELTGREEFIYYESGKRYIKNDSIFQKKWKHYTTNNSYGLKNR
ncbi:hypothetical protein ATO12_24510 [Aquimarina atlantica]|uniref:Lipoprotein n=1 Tax=Aquimarina atlantica TaxID=1317122 RepID=A0A023BQZ8_9FLAO|nr:hypothetical protein [Aquimarina atlantica]EZH72103.1 hypothetical protein ATO12_24510 [Aquimarina atlantica]